jgi:peptidoglycan-associated lipoprotein
MLLIMREYLLVCAICLLTVSTSSNSSALTLGWSTDRLCFKEQTVYFESGGTTLNDEAQRKVAEVTNYLKLNALAAVLIEGHCDHRGTVEHNRRLGDRRASVLRRELLRMGVDPNRVDTVSYGKDRPADLGHDSTARSKNRRAQFILLTPPTNSAGGGRRESTVHTPLTNLVWNR